MQLKNNSSSRAMDTVELARVRRQKNADKISLSNDTFRRRISDMSEGILDQVAEGIRASKARISLQHNGPIDMTNCAYLL